MKALILTFTLFCSASAFAGNVGGGAPYKPTQDEINAPVTGEIGLGNVGGGYTPLTDDKVL